MPYLFCIPGLLCGLALAIEDIRCRRIPLRWVIAGSVLELIAVIACGVMDNDLFVIVQAILFAALCSMVQLALAMAVPRAMGMGDVTAMLPMGLSLGLLGLIPVVTWWLAMGITGLGWIAMWTHWDPQRHTVYAGKVPYAPVIVVGALIAIAFSMMA